MSCGRTFVLRRSKASFSSRQAGSDPGSTGSPCRLSSDSATAAWLEAPVAGSTSNCGPSSGTTSPSRMRFNSRFHSASVIGSQFACAEQDRSAFFDQFTTDFFSANGALQVTESQRSDAIALCHQSAQHAALACMGSFGTTDFRDDLKKVTVPTLVIHGDADVIVPFEGSGQRTQRAVGHSQLVLVNGAPHGLNVSHAQAFNDALLSFLRA